MVRACVGLQTGLELCGLAEYCGFAEVFDLCWLAKFFGLSWGSVNL